MKHQSFKTNLILLSIYNPVALAQHDFLWPNNAEAAVSLSYDDALNSQLDNALPSLNKLQLKASFYLTLNSPTLNTRLEDWREVANQGHELGNHSIYHACRGSLPNREWVSSDNDLDRKSFNQIIREIRVANTFLKAIDGETIRTFTVPCADQFVENKNYVQALTQDFIGIKTHVGKIPSHSSLLAIKNMPVWTPEGNSGEELVAYVKKAAVNGTIANITFHGIGGDYLSISTQAHNELLSYLAKHKDIYWVDTFRNISIYVEKYQIKND